MRELGDILDGMIPGVQEIVEEHQKKTMKKVDEIIEQDAKCIRNDILVYMIQKLAYELLPEDCNPDEYVIDIHNEFSGVSAVNVPVQSNLNCEWTNEKRKPKSATEDLDTFDKFWEEVANAFGQYSPSKDCNKICEKFMKGFMKGLKEDTNED